MKTKAEIVQRLLDEKKIDAEEAVVMLTPEYPYPWVYPIITYPYNIGATPWPYRPLEVTYHTAN